MTQLNLDEIPKLVIEENQEIIDQSNNIEGFTQDMPTKSNKVYTLKKSALIFMGVIVAGVLTGFMVFNTTKPQEAPVDTLSNINSEESIEIKAGGIYGSQDTQAFSDPAEGYLKKGGINGEGSHRLLRSGGPSQTVYAISSVLDLDEFDGMHVKVWGETFAAQKAAWLMDIGRLEVLEKDAVAPFDEEI